MKLNCVNCLIYCAFYGLFVFGCNSKWKFSRIPASGLGSSNFMDTSLVPQTPEQILHLGTRKGRQHLNEFPQWAPFMPVILNVFQQQFFVRLAVQSTLARIDPRLADVPVEPPGEQQPHTPPASYALDDPLF